MSHNSSENKSCSGKYGFLWLLFVAALISADQAAKIWAKTFLAGKTAITLIPGVLEFYYVENRGMAFGMLQGRQMLFVIFCVLFLAVIGYLFVRVPKTGHYLPLTLVGGVLSAGAVGNLIDRVIRNYVVEFIYFSLIDFPVFNLADIYVVCAGIALVILVIFYYKDEDFAFIGRGHKE